MMMILLSLFQLGILFLLGLGMLLFSGICIVFEMNVVFVGIFRMDRIQNITFLHEDSLELVVMVAG